MGAVQVTASLANAWWILVFILALVLVAQVPPRRQSDGQGDGTDRPGSAPEPGVPVTAVKAPPVDSFYAKRGGRHGAGPTHPET